MEKSSGKPGYNLDSPEQIQRCLHCDKPECTNCLVGMPGPVKKDQSRFERWPELIALYERGLSYQEIGARLGLTKNAVARLVRILIQAGDVRRRKQSYLGGQVRYTVRDRETGAVLACGDGRACAQQLGVDIRTFGRIVRKSAQGKGTRVVERGEPCQSG